MFQHEAFVAIPEFWPSADLYTFAHFPISVTEGQERTACTFPDIW
jgi:hypothetical protein